MCRGAAEGELLLRLERWEEALRFFSDSLLQQPDQWADWQGLLQAARKLGDASLKAARELMQRLQGSHGHMRGPFLAELELALALVAGGGGEQRHGQLADALMDYTRRFGHRPCCFSDLVPYLAAVAEGPEGPRAALVRALEGLAEDKATGEGERGAPGQEERRQAVARLQLFIRSQQLLRFLTDPGPADLRRAVTRWSREYRATLRLNAEAEGGQREVQHGDDLVLLAAHALGCLADGEDQGQGQEVAAIGRRLEACALLEQALEWSPYNYLFRVLLVQLYGALGAGQGLVAHYNGLEVKLIQVETLSWLLLPACMKTALFTEAHSRCQHIIAFHRGSLRDAEESSSKAISIGTYCKALEISDFQRSRMARSLQLALAKVERARMELLLQQSGLEGATMYLRQLASGVLPEAMEGEGEGTEGAEWSDNADRQVGKDWTRRPRAQLEAEAETEARRNVLR
jgi:N-terminal acetyltransferase B complex non-catalytic subunit